MPIRSTIAPSGAERRARRAGAAAWLAGGAATIAAIIGIAAFNPIISQEKPPAPAAKVGRADAKIKNVVILLVDTMRASHLKCYDYFRDTCPNIDKLAAEGVLFENAFSVSPWTLTSVTSLFTGMYPAAHNVQDRADNACDELVMMAEIFKANGYKTVGYSSNISISKKFNVTQGFDEFTYFEREPWFKAHPDRPDPGYVPIEGMTPDTLKWLDQAGDAPFFMYFHCTDPHYKYMPPEQYALWGQQNPWDLYDGGIRYADDYLGRIIEHLKKQGKLDETLVIVTADHGEEWADHGGMSHGHTLYNELLHVPLVMRHPLFGQMRRSEVVRSIDVLPTLIDLCQLKTPQPPALHGRTLVPLLKGLADPKPEEQFVLGDLQYPTKMEGTSYEADGWKLIYTKQSKGQPPNVKPKQNAWELYYTRQDPCERINLVQIEPKRLVEMRGKMEKRRAELDKAKVNCNRPGLDEQTDRELRGLGYAGEKK